MSFYNTIGETGATLAKSRKSASKGDQRVLDVLNQYPNMDMSPSMIQLVMVRSKPVTVGMSGHQIFAKGDKDNLQLKPIDLSKLNLSGLKQLKKLLGSTDSIKRSLHTLHNDGLIERQEKKVKGAFGKDEFTYRIKK